MTEISTLIRHIREAAGLSQPAFAARFDPPVDTQTVNRWETGRRSPADPERVLAEGARILRERREEIDAILAEIESR